MVELSQSARPRGPFSIFFSPRESFLGVREKPRPALFAIFFILLSVLPAVGFVANVDTEALFLKQMRVSGQWEQLPDEQREQALKFGPLTYQVGAPVGAIAKRAAWIFLVALLGWALLKGGSDEFRFGACVAVVALACAPLLIADALTCAVYFARDSRSFDVMNPLQSNPASWFGVDTQTRALGAFLKRLDVFELWNVWLTGFGLSVVTTKRAKIWQAFGPPVGIYALLWIMDVIGGIVGQAQT